MLNVCVLSHVRLFVAPWTVAHQTPLSMEFPRSEYWSRLPFPPTVDLPEPGIEPASLSSPVLACKIFPLFLAAYYNFVNFSSKTFHVLSLRLIIQVYKLMTFDVLSAFTI